MGLRSAWTVRLWPILSDLPATRPTQPRPSCSKHSVLARRRSPVASARLRNIPPPGGQATPYATRKGAPETLGRTPMTFPRTLLAVLVLVPAASAAELATLEGRKITGDIVAIAGNELTFKSAAGAEKFLVTTLNSVTTGPAPKAIDAGKKHPTAELIYG